MDGYDSYNQRYVNPLLSSLTKEIRCCFALEEREINSEILLRTEIQSALLRHTKNGSVIRTRIFE